MSTIHQLKQMRIICEVERLASIDLGRPWKARGFTILDARASHPCGIFHGNPFSIFVKLDDSPKGYERFVAELRGLDLLQRQAFVTTPRPLADGVVSVDGGALLMLEAVPEIPAERRSTRHWRSIGQSLAILHQAHNHHFGLDDFHGFFGHSSQDNQSVNSSLWADFYAERRLIPRLRSAVDSGHLPGDLAAGVENVIRRLPQLCGPEPKPSLLHGDAHQGNILATAGDPVFIDPCPYFGHPEIDLALIDYFEPVPADLFAAYGDVAPIDPEFPQRRELWRIFAYLAVIDIDGSSGYGKAFLGRLADAVIQYR